MKLNRNSMFWLVIAFSMVFAFIGCGGSGGGGGTPDRTAPTVTSTSPADGATDVAVNAALSVTFSEDLDAATVDSGSFTLSGPGPGGAVTGTISYDAASTTGTFTPDADLEYSTTYTATLTTTITDAAGNPMTATYTCSFTTAAAPDTTAPTLSSTNPAAGATDVPIGATVNATFSEAMDPATINDTNFTLIDDGTSSPVSGTVSYAGNTATFTPNALDFSNTYTATVTGVVTDVAGNTLGSDTSWSFTTADAPDTAPPTVDSVTPDDGATAVAVDADVTATFNETMASATITDTSFTLSGPGGAIAGTVNYTGTTATFTPDADLASETTYTATIAATVTDVAGNPMASNYTWNFTTTDTIAPNVVSVSPTDGATDVAVGTNITATFDEPMAAGTITDTSFTLSGPGGSVSGVVSYSGTMATFTPSANLASETTYTATIANTVTDEAGNRLGSNYTWSFTTADAIAPDVDSVTPLDAATDVAITTDVTATFTEAMAAGTITTSSFTLSGPGGAVTGAVSYSGTTATFTPDADLASETTYTATITTAVTDLAGNNMASNNSWSFTTEDVAPPTVSSTNPADTATDSAIGADVTATFNEAMDEATITTTSFTLAVDGGAAVTGTVTYSGTTATFNPDADLANSTTYRATITTAATDAAGNALEEDHVWTFTTEADTTPPTVDATVPATSATGVALADNLTATFSEAMDAATITTTSFTLAVDGGGAVTGTVTYSGTTATFNPDALLANDTRYVATITTAATDVAGNALAENYVWTFSTFNDAVAPTVSSVTPADTTTNVGIPTNVTATFSEAMNAANITGSSFTLEVSGGAAVAGTVSYDSDTDTATFNPTSNLQYNTTYVATITTAVTDLAGNALATAYTWSFTTVTQTAGNWHWVGGNNTAYSAGIYGTQGVAAPTNMPGSRYYAATWTDSSGGFWLFGGTGYDVFGTLGDLNDLWYFDGAEWTWVAGSDMANQTGVYGTQGTGATGNTPGSRRNVAFCIDAADNLWLFGGRDWVDNEYNDLWRFDGTNWAWISGSQSTQQAGVYSNPNPANIAPGGRSSAVLGTAANGVDLYLFAGTGWDGFDESPTDDIGELNDLWLYNVGTGLWTFLKGSDTEDQLGVYGTQGSAAPGNTPGARRKPTAWTDSSGNLWIFGGIGSDSVTAADEGLRAPRLNDLWVFDGTDWAWMKGSDVADERGVYNDADPSNDTPGARYFGAGWIDGSDNLYLFGGRGFDGAFGIYDDRLSDLWMYDGTNWSWIAGSDTSNQPAVYSDPDASNIGPGARSAATGWLDSTGNIWLFGGFQTANPEGAMNDMWLYIPVPAP